MTQLNEEQGEIKRLEGLKNPSLEELSLLDYYNSVNRIMLMLQKLLKEC